MASGSLSAPGTEYGPCKDACVHIDCMTTRAMARTDCSYCHKAIGYDRGFYNVAGEPGIVADPPDAKHVLAHADCHERAILG